MFELVEFALKAHFTFVLVYFGYFTCPSLIELSNFIF